MPPTASATCEVSTIRLADTITVRLRVEGPTPLRVELPPTLLTPESALCWKITPDGPARLRVAGPGEQWEQAFAVSPYVPGEEVVLAFQAVRVSGAEVPVNALVIRVETSLTGAKADDVRPVTDIERLPPVVTPSVPLGPLVVLALCVAVVAAGVLLFLRHSRRRGQPLAPNDWLNRRHAELVSALTANAISPGVFAEQFSSSIREYLTRRFQLTTEPLTTVELLAAGDQRGVWDTATRAVLAELLETCDRIKFAGHQPETEECLAWVDRVRSVAQNWGERMLGPGAAVGGPDG